MPAVVPPPTHSMVMCRRSLSPSAWTMTRWMICRSISLRSATVVVGACHSAGIFCASCAMAARSVDERLWDCVCTKWIGSVKHFWRRPAGAAHCTAECGTARRELVLDTAGGPWGTGEGLHTAFQHAYGGETPARHARRLRGPPPRRGLRRTRLFLGDNGPGQWAGAQMPAGDAARCA